MCSLRCVGAGLSPALACVSSDEVAAAEVGRGDDNADRQCAALISTLRQPARLVACVTDDDKER